MATQDQLMQFGNTSSSDDSSDESSDELISTLKIKKKPKKAPPASDESSDELVPAPKDVIKEEPISSDEESTEELMPPPKKPPTKKAPKLAPKLKLRFKLPMAKPETNARRSPESSDETEPVEVTAEAVKTEDEGEIVSATVVGDDEDEDATTVVAEPVVSATRTTQQPKKRQSVRPIKMPAIASPGLLLANGNTTEAQFDHHMKMAGYSLETRKENPHRGSSTKRQVGDMFDSSVALHSNFPKLVPPELIADTSTSGGEGQEPKLVQFLKKGLKDPSNGKRKRRFDEMMPLSLRIKYPDEYVQQRKEYIKKVKARENAVVESQEAELEDTSPVKIPSIPEPPAPPKLEEQGLDLKDKHPLYVPKNEDFVKHLDQNCFNSAEGRYVGLSTNSISDPHFVGAHSVGVQNLSVTAGTGLATTQTGSTSAGSASLASTVYGDRSGSSNSKGESSKGSDKKEAPAPAASSSTPAKPKKKKAAVSPSPSASTSPAGELKKIMEGDTNATEVMRKCIIRAGVYASRTGRHGQSFLGPDGNMYQDVSKTFAAYSNLKPCTRCKNNKQGVYHCRLRRKHKDLDFDGTNSTAMLEPLFEEPLELLVLKKE